MRDAGCGMHEKAVNRDCLEKVRGFFRGVKGNVCGMDGCPVRRFRGRGFKGRGER